jgi:hypothetical protein
VHLCNAVEHLRHSRPRQEGSLGHGLCP